MTETAKKVVASDLDYTIEISEQLAEFDRPFDEMTRVDLLANGFATPAHRALYCLGWIWRQWLAEAPKEVIRQRVQPLVEMGLMMRARCRSWHKRHKHDLLLLHCAIFGSDESQLKQVLEAIADASGENGDKPADDGELYAAAWSGMMKYWMLGDQDKALEQSNLIWGAYRERYVLFVAGPKSLATPWLKKDWRKFVIQQQKDFDRLWTRARKDAYTIRSESPTEIVVRTDGYRIGHQWCWSHCAMALLAHRQDVDVMTDPLWFPPHALKCAGCDQ